MEQCTWNKIQKQGRKEAYEIGNQMGGGDGIRDQEGGIWDHSPGIGDQRPWDRDQQFFLGIKDMGIRLYHIRRIREQNWSRIWREGLEICVQKWDQH